MTEGFSISLSVTKKIGVKGITCTLLATFLFLSVGPSLGKAEHGTICFYVSAWECHGVSVCCTDVSSDHCCQESRNEWGHSADVKPASYGESYVYASSDCVTGSYYSNFGYLCSRGHRLFKFGSGRWHTLRPARNIDGAELGSDKSCNKTVSADTFQYKFITEDRRRASWVLPMASLAEADSDGPFLDLPAEEQVIWFKSRGATLDVEDHQTTPDSKMVCNLN